MANIKGSCPIANIEDVNENILDYIRGILYDKYGSHKPLRAVHAKSTGLVKAILKVKEKLPEHLKVGLFKEEKTYDALIRFTNGAGTPSPDKKSAVRGMAIKVLLEKENTEKQHEATFSEVQDFILSTSTIFVPGTYTLQASAIRAALEECLFDQIINGLPSFIKYKGAALNFLNSRKVIPNILEEEYHSGTPYSFGKRAIKWHARPNKLITSVMPQNPSNDFLRGRLIADLLKEEFSFNLFVQFQENELTEPIDDCTVDWNTEIDSNQVATITIPIQNIDTSEMINMDVSTSFSPGHALPEHAPLGSVNMVRQEVYETLAKERLTHH